MNVRFAEFEELKTTVENSSTDRLEPAKFIDTLPELVNVTVAVPLSHEALAVDEFVHVPVTVQDSEPNRI